MRWFLYSIFLLLSFALVLFILDPDSSLGKLWFQNHPGSLNLLQATIQRYIHPDLWTSVFVPLLKQPSWYTPTIIAGFLAVPYFLIRIIKKRP